VRDSTFVVIIIACVLLLTFSLVAVTGEEQNKKTIKFNWSWNQAPSFCILTEEYRMESELAITLWSEALGENFEVDYKFIDYGGRLDNCNNYLLFFPNATYKTGMDVMGYADCSFRHSSHPYCLLVIATDRDEWDMDVGYSITTTIMHEMGHSYGLGHSKSKSLNPCIDDIMHTPHCIKTLQILPFHVEAIKCRYGDDGWYAPNYRECKKYEEYVE